MQKYAELQVSEPMVRSGMTLVEQPSDDLFPCSCQRRTVSIAIELCSSVLALDFFLQDYTKYTSAICCLLEPLQNTTPECKTRIWCLKMYFLHRLLYKIVHKMYYVCIFGCVTLIIYTFGESNHYTEISSFGILYCVKCIIKPVIYPFMCY